MQVLEIKKQYCIVLTQSEKKIHASQRKQTEKDFETFIAQTLRLKKSSSFWNLEDDFSTLYDNFKLLSYLSSDLQVQILTRVYGNGKDYIQADLFTLHSQQQLQFLIIQKRRKNMNGKLPSEDSPLQIQYQILPLTFQFQSQQFQGTIEQKINNYILNLNKKQLNRKKVIIYTRLYTVTQTFVKSQKKSSSLKNDYLLCHIKKGKMVFQTERQLIKIKIYDQQGWIAQNFQKVQHYNHRTSQLRKSMIGQIQYFYLQPESQRNKIIKGPHISLALQGGGCKGVQYIGAYKAKISCMPKINITSIIGSSAGSILGLAICLKLSPEQIEKICVQKLSKVTDDQKYKQISIEGQKFIKQTYQKIMDSLKNFNIFQPQLLDIVEKCLQDQKIQQKILQLIEASTNPEVYKLFTTKDKKTKPKLNLLGFLNGTLMTGKIIKTIAIHCIKIYLLSIQKEESFLKLKIKFNKQNKLTQAQQIQLYQLNSRDQLTKLDELDKISQRLTMEQLYELTGVQFTCTAVDIKNQILRFLNQKTTPNLPICKAVQMSGSFPVAFQAQSWKKHWGKYYIHYDDIRKQIDLTGCHLTDGGTLANFPIKYLDNQDMRPMYFSHKKTHQTIIYGIGLIEDLPKQQQKAKRISEVASQLGKLATNIIGKCNPICSWLSYKFKCKKPEQKIVQINPQHPFSAFTQIPIIKFIMDLLYTYSFTKDNLTEECFSQSAYETSIKTSYINQIQNRIDPTNLSQQLMNLSAKINQLLIYQKSDPFETFIKNITQLINLDQFQPNQTQICQIASTMNQIMSNFMHKLLQIAKKNNKISYFYSTMVDCDMTLSFKDLNLRQSIKILSHQQKNEQLIKKYLSIMLSKIRLVLCAKQFRLSSIQQDFKLLHEILKSLLKFCNKLNQKPELINQCLGLLRQKQIQQIQNVSKQVKNYSKLVKQQNFKPNKKVAFSLSKIKQICITLPLKNIKQLHKYIRVCSVPDLFIHEQAQSHRFALQSYTFKRINNFYRKKRKFAKGQTISPDGLHLVLESVALSQLYFHEYYLSVKDALLNYNNKIRDNNIKEQKQKLVRKNINDNQNQQILSQLSSQQEYKQLKITSMTATGYHSIIIFLHSSDLSDRRIGTEVWKIRDLIKMDKKHIQHKYNKADWAKVTPIMIREIQKQAIEKKKDIFKYIEQDILKNQDKYKNQFSKIKQQIQNQIQDVRLSNQDLINTIETSLSYIVNVLMQLEKQEMTSENISQMLQDKLILKWRLDHNSEQIRTKFSNRIQGIFQFFYQKYKDIIHYVFLSSPFVIEQVIKLLKPDEREEAWKGIILSQFLNINHIKVYVQQILQQLKLDKNVTLKQFYWRSSKKIQINFSVVDGNCVNILNYKTRPNMPVWAAVVAASSIPQFFPPLLDRPQWRQKQQQDFQKRHVISYFQNANQPYKFLTSSEAITRLPLDLLQNNKFRKKITDKNNEIFLIFNFMNFKFKSIFKKQKKQFKINSLTLGECISKFLSFKSMIFKCCQQGRKEQRILYDQQKNIKALKMLIQLPFIQAKSRILNLYINSHDNLITKLYKKELVQMPIRYSTLDFHLMTKKIKQKESLSDTCQDSIMQAQFILSEKINNRKVNSSKMRQMNINQSIQQNYLLKYSQDSKRRIYFRVQSVVMKKKQKIGSGQSKLNAIQQTKQKNLIRVYPQKMSEQQFSDIKIKKNYEDQFIADDTHRYQNKNSLYKDQQNILKLRILSMLNPSRQLYQKYHIYYRIPKQHQQKKIFSSKKQNNQQKSQKPQQDQKYIRIVTQSINIPYSKYKQTNSLQIKIEYPSLNLRQVKTSCFYLNLDNLFELNTILLESKEDNKFGFVYYIQFDKIYPQQNLNPQNFIKTYQDITQTYGEVHDFEESVLNIKIKSNIQHSVYRSVLCEDCIQQLTVKNKQGRGCYYCKKCKMQDKVSHRFDVSYNTKKGRIQCSLGHRIMNIFGETINKAEGQKLQFIICNICEKACIDCYWSDPQCKIIFCDFCRTQCQET